MYNLNANVHTVTLYLIYILKVNLAVTTFSKDSYHKACPETVVQTGG